jgi:hypothetical protein
MKEHNAGDSSLQETQAVYAMSGGAHFSKGVRTRSAREARSQGSPRQHYN